MKNNRRFVYETRPCALEENTVIGAKYRFTVLTPALLRMEYSPGGAFEDRASQVVFFRDFPENTFTIGRYDGRLRIETAELILTYRENEAFSADTLRIRLKNEPATAWNYGDEYEDLGGTARTLDLINGALELGGGVCSRSGFSVLDDSGSLLLNDIGWVEPRRPGTVDSYFWGYGWRYKDAVKDLYRLTGVPPMLPAYALGNWWSRYNRYTQQEYESLILSFEKENIPFSVGVVDMDWHIVKIPEECKTENDPRLENGNTGYTWNKELFGDHKAFLAFMDHHGLKTALNLHPSAGVGCHEEMYAEMAKACGVDPSTRRRIRLDVLSPEFMENYFDILHHPHEEDGVNFWWMDWQQGTAYWWIHEENTDGRLHDPREAADPLWMLNHLHIADIKRNGKRPMFFSRYSGVGSQRYPVGFSGDTLVTWESLDFQPYFTATASNVGYCWWSHDIGGHLDGYRDDELTTRWIQLGVFSPINRLHSTNNEFVRKEPWCYEEHTAKIMEEWLRLRHRLFPYIYTMNHRTHAALEPMVQPMYYAYPKNSAAYEVKNQFMFGSELMAAPITSPNSRLTHMGSVRVWLPRGDWFDFFTGLHYTSRKGRMLTVCRGLSDYPVFARAGAIVPMQTGHALKAGNDLSIAVFPGADNSFTLYEDAGEGYEFEKGGFVKTEMTLAWGEHPVFTVRPVEGDPSVLPQKRRYSFVLRGFSAHIFVDAFIDGTKADFECAPDAQTGAVTVTLSADTSALIKLVISGDGLITDNGTQEERIRNVLLHSQISNDMKLEIMDIVRSVSPVSDTIIALNRHCSNGVEYSALLDCLKEQLTLTE